MAMSLAAYHEEMQQNIDQATSDLRETLEQMEIQNVELGLAKSVLKKPLALNRSSWPICPMSYVHHSMG